MIEFISQPSVMFFIGYLTGGIITVLIEKVVNKLTKERKYVVHSYSKEHLVVGGNVHGYTCKTNHKQNAELIAKILNDDENGISSVYKAWEQYKGKGIL